MIGRKEAKNLAQQAIDYSQADQTEVLLLGEDSSLTRFSNSAIHQNVAESNVDIRVRVVFGKRVGVASTNDLDPDAIRRTVDEASQMARLQPENPQFVSLPGPAPVQGARGYAESTAEATAEQRAEAVGTICRLSKERNLKTAGAFTTATSETAILNSLGVDAYYTGTAADLSTVAIGEDSSGYAAQVAVDVEAINAEALAREAIERAERGRRPSSLEPGAYEVILDEYAVLDMVDFLAYLGFSATALQEETSFMTGKLGQKILGNNVSIWDDGHDPAGLPLPFDFEGVPKQRVSLVEGGVAKGVVYDSYTAGKEGKSSTGHALPAPNTFGPLPLNLFMQAGDATREDMIRSTKRGLLVTRFWYTEPVHPLFVVVTGMTRDGTFLIENGQIVGAIRNMRFTQSYLEALSQVEAISRETKILRGLTGACRVPAIKVAQFNFTGVTEF
ncbi:MAG: TldD/PmbA family protein [Dehalococcoidales bacterium]|nr:TldD/PmbA family protein [Dehalococcoidales bacterium]